MTTVAPVDAPADAFPVAFGGLFGWISLGRNARGVILCGTHGYEQHCAHRPWRTLARRIAATGCTVLRMDHPGTGDSSDDGADRLEGWIDAIHRAAAFLRDTAEVEEIVLVGFRLGGTLAALAARDVAADRLVLLDPFVTGRAFLREMSLQARVIDVLPDGRPFPAGPGRVAAGGFALDPNVVAALGTVDLTRSDRAPAPDILLMGADRGGLAAHYRALGARIATVPFPDLAQLCANALTATMSEDTLAVVAAAVAQGAGSGPGPKRAPPRAARIATPAWHEEALHLASGAFAIRCGPNGTAAPSAAVLFLNMGADVHTGHGRQTTELARRLATLGVESLRIDLRGVGDSPDRPDGALPLYNLAALDDVRAAVDVLSRPGSGPIVATGICSGAYMAFQALCQDARIRGAVLVNPYCFDWALTHGDVPFTAQPIRTLATYSSLARRGATWQRLLTGRMAVLPIVSRLAKGLGRSALVALGRLLRRERRDSIAQRIARLRLRGARLALLYSAGDLGLVDLHARLGPSLPEIDRIVGTPVRILAEADHAFGANAAREALFETVRTLIGALHDGTDGAADATAFRPIETALPA